MNKGQRKEFSNLDLDGLQEVTQFLFSLIQKSIRNSLRLKWIFLLKGDLGAGKTEIVKRMLTVLAPSEKATSPTFAIHQKYVIPFPLNLLTTLNPSEHSQFPETLDLDHYDLYRIKDSSDLETSGLWDQIQYEDLGIIFIEWPDQHLIEQIPRSWNVALINLQVVENMTSKAIRNIEIFYS